MGVGTHWAYTGPAPPPSPSSALRAALLSPPLGCTGLPPPPPLFLSACAGQVHEHVLTPLPPRAQGYAGQVYEHVLGEEKYTFVEDVRHPHSCTILIRGPNDHTIAQAGPHKLCSPGSAAALAAAPAAPAAAPAALAAAPAALAAAPAAPTAAPAALAAAPAALTALQPWPQLLQPWQQLLQPWQQLLQPWQQLLQPCSLRPGPSTMAPVCMLTPAHAPGCRSRTPFATACGRSRTSLRTRRWCQVGGCAAEQSGAQGGGGCGAQRGAGRWWVWSGVERRVVVGVQRSARRWPVLWSRRGGW